MSGLAKSADNLIKVARVDEESSLVSSEEEVMDRLHAFFMALEYLVVCEFSIKEGPMLYIKELQEFRDETKGLSFLIKADQLFRKEIARLMSDKRAQCPTFSGTLLLRSGALQAPLGQGQGGADIGSPESGFAWWSQAPFLRGSGKGEVARSWHRQEGSEEGGAQGAHACSEGG